MILKFVTHTGSQNKLFNLFATQTDLLVVSDCIEEFYDNYVNPSVFYNKDFFGDASLANKIVVENSHKIDKIALGNIILFAKENKIDVDFYGIKLDSNGLLFDSSEYLVAHCSHIEPSQLN